MAENTTDKKKGVIVLPEIPKQEVRLYTDDKGITYDLISIDEALTEILTSLREIKKSLV